MKCNCSAGNIVLAIIILILGLWPELLGMYSQWIIVIAAALLIIHEIMHKHSWMTSSKTEMAIKKKKR